MDVGQAGDGVTDSSEKFVNPYTFVPFPDTPPVRSDPNTHIANPDLFRGKLSVTITARTSVLIHGFGTEKRPDLPRNSEGQVIIPGSSWKGAIRSLHETMTGSCLRVFNGDFIPGYRDLALEGSTSNLRMAIVDEPATEETEPTLLLCPEPEDGNPSKIPHTLLLDAARGREPLKSGERLKLDISCQTGEACSATPDEDGQWVVSISDAAARTKPPVYKAQVRPYPAGVDPIPVPKQVWNKFLHAVDGARDLTTSELRRRTPDDVYAPVTFRGDTIGQRHYASRRLFPGQPVWVQIDANHEITSLRLAMLWRHSGSLSGMDGYGDDRDGSAKERVDRGFHACTDWTHLCPSCQVFGSADTSGKDTPEARQNSYRGHVRFSDATANGKVTPNTFTRAPMSSPRPGSGQFYLVNDERAEGNVGDPPLREWGSHADRHTGRSRRLRGRKYYWHTPVDPPQPRRAKKRPHQSNELAEEVSTIPPKTRLTGTVMFENLNEFQLGSLLAALQPSTLLTAPDGSEIWQHIGGGKPLGLGGCSVVVNEAQSSIEKVGARYGSQAETVPVTTADLISAFREKMHAEQADVVATWTPLTKALASKSVSADLVWYPPGAGWKPKTVPKEAEESGFDFWTQRSGTELRPKNRKRQGHPLRSLPPIDASDQSMPVVGRQPAQQVDRDRLSSDGEEQ